MDKTENILIPVSVWNDGGNGYGIRLSNHSRDKYFSKDWKTINLYLQGEEKLIKIRLSHCFWNNCSELRSIEIRKWLINNNLVPWKKFNPPRLLLLMRKDGFYLCLNHHALP